MGEIEKERGKMPLVFRKDYFYNSYARALSVSHASFFFGSIDLKHL